MLEDISKHTKLVVAVGTATALGTLAVCRLVQRRTSPGKKRAAGPGPTGNGKWKLYHAHSFMSARCVWLLEEMKVTDDFEIIEHNPHTASLEEKYQCKKTVHPHGTIPAMVTSEGTLMAESAAICLYLAQIYGKYLPDERNEPTYYNWSVYSSSTADSCIRIVYRQLYTINEKDSDSKLLETNVTKCLEWVNCLESLLAQDNREYICTNGFTAADVIVGYSVFWLSLINEGALIKHVPSVQQYLHRIKMRPLWSKCMDGPNGTDPDWVAITRKTTRR